MDGEYDDFMQGGQAAPAAYGEPPPQASYAQPYPQDYSPTAQSGDERNPALELVESSKRQEQLLTKLLQAVGTLSSEMATMNQNFQKMEAKLAEVASRPAAAAPAAGSTGYAAPHRNSQDGFLSSSASASASAAPIRGNILPPPGRGHVMPPPGRRADEDNGAAERAAREQAKREQEQAAQAAALRRREEEERRRAEAEAERKRLEEERRLAEVERQRKIEEEKARKKAELAKKTSGLMAGLTSGGGQSGGSGLFDDDEPKKKPSSSLFDD